MLTADVLNQTYKHVYEDAFNAHKSGQLKAAKDLYEQILKTYPNHADSLHLLGLIFHQSGYSDQAEGLIQKAVGLSPNNPLYLCNLASVLNVLKKYKAAEKAAASTLKLNPQDPDGYHNLGIAQLLQNKYEKAEDALNKAVALSPNNPEYLNNLGAVLNKQNKFAAAADAFVKATKADPNNSVSYTNLAGAVHQLGRIEDAYTACQKALNLNAEHAPSYFTLGQIELDQGNDEAAIKAFKACLKIAPKQQAKVYVGLASAHSNTGDAKKAYECLEKSRALDPHSVAVCHRLALWHSEAGDLDKSLKLLKEAIKRDPGYALAYYELAESKRYRFNAQTIHHLQTLIQSPNLALKDKVRLNFALAIEFGQTDAYEQSSEHYLKANELQKSFRDISGHSHDVGSFDSQLSEVEQFFNKEYFINSAQKNGSDSTQPVFIVGLPRSGTTLIERIISSHPSAQSVGESTKIPRIINDIRKKYGTYPDALSDIQRSDLAKHAEDYLSHIQHLTPSSERIIDKLPFNFQHLGLIQSLFPKAKIIHCIRNRIDVGLSCFMQNFADGKSVV